MTGPTGAAGLPVSLQGREVSLCPSVPTTKSRTKTHGPEPGAHTRGGKTSCLELTEEELEVPVGHSRGQVLLIARLEPSTSAPVLSSRVPKVPPLLLSRIQIHHNTERGCWPRGLNSAPICNAFAWSYAANAK